MSNNIIARLLICSKVAMLIQEPIRTRFVDMWASPGFLVWSPAFLFFFSKTSERERAPFFFFLPSVTRVLPLSPAPHHLFRSTNFHLKHVELILPVHRFLFSPLFFEKPPILNSKVIEKHNNKTSPAQFHSFNHWSHFAIDCVCLSVFLPLSFLSSTFISPFGKKKKKKICLTETKHALEGDRERQEEGKGGRQEGGDHERKKEMEKERGGQRAQLC